MQMWQNVHNEKILVYRDDGIQKVLYSSCNFSLIMKFCQNEKGFFKAPVGFYWGWLSHFSTSFEFLAKVYCLALQALILYLC